MKAYSKQGKQVIKELDIIGQWANRTIKWCREIIS
jgi:hypothetical protein